MIKHNIRVPRAGERAADAFLLHGAFRFPKAGGVAQDEGEAVEVERNFDDVARRSRLMKDDRRFTAGKRIQQARLANVRRADYRDLDAFANDLAPAAVGQRAFKLRDEARALAAAPRSKALSAISSSSEKSRLAST